MKKRHSALAVLVAFGVSAFAAGHVAAQQKTYKVGLDGTFAPHAMPKLDGGIEGFNVDLANEIGKRLGAKMDIVATQFSGLIPGMQAGTYDFIVAPTTMTPERAQSMLFTEGYLNTDFQFVVAANAPEITDMKQFKDKVIAVNKGAVYDKWARDLEPQIGWKVESYGTNSDAIQAVIAGRAFANVGGNTVSAWAVKQNSRIKLSYLHSTGAVFGMPFRKDDKELRNRVEEAIECMKLDGTMVKLSEKWFGIKPAAGSAAITVQPGYGQPGLDGYDPTEHKPNCG